MHIYVYDHTYTYTSIFLRMCIYIYVEPYVCVCMCIYIYIYIYVYMHVCIHIHIHLYICKCIYIYISLSLSLSKGPPHHDGSPQMPQKISAAPQLRPTQTLLQPSLEVHHGILWFGMFETTDAVGQFRNTSYNKIRPIFQLFGVCCIWAAFCNNISSRFLVFACVFHC